MSPITNDADYQEAIKDLLVDLKGWSQPGSLPLMPDQQARFIQTTLHRVAQITESEPHLRGAVVSSLSELKGHELDNLSKDYGKLLTVAQELYQVLTEIPAARLGRGLQVRRKMALELADKTL